jgi:transcriptional regulator with XRE-family HTH domain
VAKHLSFFPMPGSLTEQTLKNIADARKAQAITQAQMAKKICVCLRQYQNIEHNRTSLTLACLEQIAAVLGIPPEKLIAPRQP